MTTPVFPFETSPLTVVVRRVAEQYAFGHLWGNPEENQQYQVQMSRISYPYGVNMPYNYMGKWRTIPKQGRYYHVFSVGGLDGGYWNIRNNVLRRNPLDRWINMAQLGRTRGLQVDVYNTKGFQFSRANCWVMMTYDDLVLIAIEKLRAFPVDPLMYFRCYGQSDRNLVDWGDELALPTSNGYAYETMTYEVPSELVAFNTRYTNYKARPGYTGVFHNGVFWDGTPSSIPNLVIGDIVEIWHDPSVIKVERYQYKDLQDFYSTLDSKRKLIIHPPKVDGDWTIRYFDDNDYYLLGTGNRGLYFQRNDVTAIRQLTHKDVAIADDLVVNASNYLPELEDLNKITILVLVRGTAQTFDYPHEHNRIRYLYRFDDEGILKAMTGDRSTIPEWSAPGLEESDSIRLMRSQYKDIVPDLAINALGYNAASRVFSECVVPTKPVNSNNPTGPQRAEIGASYPAGNFWEYDANGQLIGYYNATNANGLYNCQNDSARLVECFAGDYTRSPNYIVTTSTVLVTDIYKTGFRVYKAKWSVALGEVLWNTLEDVTNDTAQYELVEVHQPDGRVDAELIWKNFDTLNNRGIILYQDTVLAYTFQLEHIDHSLAFALTEIYEDGGAIFPLAFANVDLFLNNHPLIDKVDWIWDDQYCYIINKEFIVPGAQTITVRASYFSPDKEDPIQDIELGFVEGGEIGRFDRYNLRDDRTTRLVVGGKLILTDTMPSAELSVGSDLPNPLNGRPYMVKHMYVPVKDAYPYDFFKGYDRSRELDRRICDYMTEYLPKPGVQYPVGGNAIPNLQDKYRLFSPFMNVIANGIVNGFITVPQGELTAQDVHNMTGPYGWWIQYDPIYLEFDRRYFAVMPFANTGKLTVNSRELIFLNSVNALFLDNACVLEGYFEVNNNVRP